MDNQRTHCGAQAKRAALALCTRRVGRFIICGISGKDLHSAEAVLLRRAMQRVANLLEETQKMLSG